MKASRISEFLLANVLVVITFPCASQNLVPNPDYEIFTECPENVGNIDKAIPWTRGNEGSTDYFHICSTGNAGVPDNSPGSQWPVSGVAYSGVVSRRFDDYREYLRTQLAFPLSAGASYNVSFYVSVADDWCRTTAFGALFTIDTPAYSDDQFLPYIPQIEVNGDFVGDYESWTFISRCFIAEGGEQFITIGNFRENSQCGYEPWCGEGAYYYVDQVSVVESPLSGESFVLDPVISCDSFEINPGQAQAYLWDDGTTNPTLVAFESGTYHVTLSDECAFQYGEIEVTIIPSAPPVVLPNDTLLCTGESIEITLDGDAGEYLWQDGSESNEYIILSSGSYSVSLTDACETTSDTINVTFLDPPVQFSLGADTLICNGDAFTVSFDPSMGYFMWQDGSDASNYTINEDGTYALTISNMCGQVEDEIAVEFIEPILFSIGPDQMILCDGDEVEIELDPLMGDFLWNDNSTDNTYTVTGEATVSVTITNACESVSDEMLVSVLYAPEFTLGPDITVCSGQFPITLNMSDVDHAQYWEWSDGSTQSVYQVAGPGTYNVTISNDCFAMSDDIVISIGDADPVVTLPADQLLCPGQTYILDAGGLIGDYHWSTSTGSVSDADTFLVTEVGTYYLTVTNICGSGSDSVIINYVPTLSPPDLGADFSLCPGETGVLYANVDGVSYQWSTSTDTLSAADSLVINAAGTYFLQISDECSSAKDTIVISSNANPPDVDLPLSLDLCQGDTLLVDAGITGVQYLWDDGTQLSSIIVNTAGTYSLTVSNACGSDVDSIIINDAGSSPTVSLGNDVEICPGDVALIIPVSNGVESWLWMDSSTSSMLNVQSSGLVYVVGSNQCGSASDTIIVTVLPEIPTLDLGTDLSICPGETLTLSITEPDVEILWNDQSSDDQLIVDEAGVVFATISNACGSSSDTIVVELLPDVPALDLGADQSLCPGETITLDPGIADVTYVWQDASTGSATADSIFAVDTPGTIILTISNACGSSTDTIGIIEDTNGPQLDLGPDILACEGDTVILEAGISGVEYLWQTSGGVSTGSTTAITFSDLIILAVSNACGSDSDTVVVDIHGTIPMPSLGPDTTLCDDEILILLSDADDDTDIEWSDGSSEPSLMVSGAGTYILYEANHCGSASDSILVSYESAPLPFDLGEDVVLCPGESIVLNAPVTTDLFTWQDGSHGTSFIAEKEQVYSLQLSNDCGITSDEVSVSFDDDIPELSLDPTISLCDDEVITLVATQPFAAIYSWSTGSVLPSIQINTPGDYSVSVSTNCYTVDDAVQVLADADCDNVLFIPNVFSPNGDNINDEWVIVPNDPDIISIECRVFDRWGDLVFTATEIPIVWNGQFNSKELNPGVYVYLVILTKQDGESDVRFGDITLVR